MGILVLKWNQHQIKIKDSQYQIYNLQPNGYIILINPNQNQLKNAEKDNFLIFSIGQEDHLSL
jgi:hypothetical protein